MASEKMQAHLAEVDAKDKFKEVKEIKEQQTGTDSRLGQLALEIDVTSTKESTEGKTDSFNKIDQLFATLDASPEKKQLALQYALEAVGLEIGEGENSRVVGLRDIVRFFNKAVTQKEEGSWQLAMNLDNSNLTDDEKAIGAKFQDVIDNPKKHSAFAYLIQRSASEIANLQVARGYGRESRRNLAEKVKADMYLGNQTRSALNALDSWIQSDLSDYDEVNESDYKNLTVSTLINKRFISETLKNKLEETEENGIDQKVKDFWSKLEDDEGNKYIRRLPGTNNYALKLEGSDDSETVDIAMIVGKLKLKDRQELTKQKQQELHTQYGIPEGTDAIYKRDGHEGYYFFENGKLSFIPELIPGKDNIDGPVKWNYDAQNNGWEKTLLPESENAKAYIKDALLQGLKDSSIPIDGKDVVFKDGNWCVSSFGYTCGIKQTLTEGWVVKGNTYDALKKNLKCANLFNRVRDVTKNQGNYLKRGNGAEFKIKDNTDFVLYRKGTSDLDLVSDDVLRAKYPELVDSKGGKAFCDDLNKCLLTS